MKAYNDMPRIRDLEPLKLEAMAHRRKNILKKLRLEVQCTHNKGVGQRGEVIAVGGKRERSHQ
jgi:hypothetical protein